MPAVRYVVAPDGASVRVPLKVVPRASRARVVGVLGDRWKVAVASPPEAGKANDEVRRLLAEVLGVPASSVSVVEGLASPRKTARVAGLDAAAVDAALSRAVSS
jgi:uncharacterized protein (TIGR00251 family)